MWMDIVESAFERGHGKRSGPKLDTQIANASRRFMSNLSVYVQRAV